MAEPQEPSVTGTRPHRLIVVAGTATEIGKTWVTAHLAETLIARDLTVAARKPAQSHELGDSRTDADVLAEATGEDPMVVCPPHRRYEVPMAPPMAAEVLGRPLFFLDELIAEVSTSWPSPAVNVGLVELAGAPRSPIATDGDGVMMSGALLPDVIVIVAAAGLGTIGAVRAAADSFRPDDDRFVVYLNRYDDRDDLHRRNRQWLADRDRFQVAVDIDELARDVTAPRSVR